MFPHNGTATLDTAGKLASARSRRASSLMPPMFDLSTSSPREPPFIDRVQSLAPVHLPSLFIL